MQGSKIPVSRGSLIKRNNTKTQYGRGERGERAWRTAKKGRGVGEANLYGRKKR